MHNITTYACCAVVLLLLTLQPGDLKTVSVNLLKNHVAPVPDYSSFKMKIIFSI